MHGIRFDEYVKVTQGWIDNGFVEKAPAGCSEWLVQGFVVPKKSPVPGVTAWRGVVDLRSTNSQTRRTNYPLPRIDDLLIKQGGCTLFSIIDLKQAFHQMPLDPESRPCTCTNTPLGVYQWKVQVMGLMNASCQFQQMMDDILQPVSDTTTPFIDDILGHRRKGGPRRLCSA
jgi:hypothetical protein